MNITKLLEKSRKIRKTILEVVCATGKGHIGGAFSCTDILVALYHGGVLRFDPQRPDWEERSRFILSKGHASIALFSVLADLGFFEESELKTYCQDGSRLGGHPDRRVPGVEADTGSLGMGLGIGAGMALTARIDNRNYKTVVLLGDGECYEGSVWEAAMFSAHHKLGNLTVIVDRNGQCVTDFTEDCNQLEPFSDKWRSFGWEVLDIDGHDFNQILEALSTPRNVKSDKPMAVIARTIKGRGVSFMEGCLCWHHGVPKAQEKETALRELSHQGRGTP